MQKLPIYLYPNILEVILDVNNEKGNFTDMYQRDIVIQKGVKTDIQLQFKNSDQKDINISSSTFVMLVVDPQDRQARIQKAVTLIDDGVTRSKRGLGTVTFLESDTINLESKIYSFAVLKQEQTGLSATYSNTYYSTVGRLELREDIYPMSKPSQKTTVFQSYMPNDVYSFVSDYFYADPQLQNGRAIHTIAVYSRDFTGKLYVDATLDTTPSTYGNFDTVKTKQLNSYTGITYLNFYGIFSRVRLRFEKDLSDQDAESLNPPVLPSKIDKILYRS